MKTSPKELRAERAGKITAARALLDAKDATQEQIGQADALLAEAGALDKRIASMETAERLDNELQAARVVEAAVAGVSVDQVVDAKNAALAREKRILTAMLRAGVPDSPGVAALLSEEDRAHYAANFGKIQNAASTGSPAGGGYTIAPAFQRDLLIAMKLQGGMREVAAHISTDTGVVLPWPTLDDRGNGAYIVGENALVPDANDLQFGSVNMLAIKVASGILKVSVEILQDSAFDFDALIRAAVALRMQRFTNQLYTTGTGAGQPQGIVTAATLGKTLAAGNTTSVGFDDFLDLQASVDPYYRANASFMMHDTTLQTLRKLKDSTGRYLWQSQEDSTAGAPAGGTIWGRPVVINQDMPVMAAGAKSVLYGDFSNYLIRDVLGMQAVVLKERYADYLQVGYIFYLRTDGRLISAAQPIKYLANSAT